MIRGAILHTLALRYRSYTGILPPETDALMPDLSRRSPDPHAPRALFLDGPKGPAVIRPFDLGALPEGDVTVRVACSSLNYKDALALTGKGKIVRGAFPFVPGIDLAGTVEASESDAFAPGDRVVLTGWGTGEVRWGGLATHARAQGKHLVRLPGGLSAFEAMALGTAGFTAMLAVLALDHAGFPDSADEAGSEVLVTGASGGVGSLAVHLLARAGHRVVASSGKDPAYLHRLGAAEVVGRDALGAGTHRALETGRWRGAVDTVGGATLSAVLASMQTRASVAACGNAQSADLATTVFPFILRGVNLLGIDSNTCPAPLREAAWAELAARVDRSLLAEIATTISLDEVPAWAEALSNGQVRGRVVVQIEGDEAGR